ncbi:MAG: hypothetical protein ACOX41_08660 [Anaerovoracaceae bacterium]
MKKTRNPAAAAAAAIAGAGIMLLCIFVPFVSAGEELEDSLDTLTAYEEFGVDGMDSVSVFKFNTFYYQNSTELFNSSEDGMIYLGLLIALLVFAVLALVSTLRRKPVLSLVFGILTLLTFLAEYADFVSRGVVADDAMSYHWSIAFYLCYVGAALLLAGAIAMLVQKRRQRRAERQLNTGN